VRLLLCFLFVVQATASLSVAGADEPARSAEETVAAMSLPAGFRASVFAAEPDVVQPLGFDIDDRGRLWVAEALAYPNWKAEGNDRITVLEDSDGDGRADRRTVFYDKLNYVTGVAWGFGGAWVLSPPSLLFIPDRDGDAVPDGPAQVLLDGFGHQGVHNLVNGATWGPDGWLYGGHGGSSYSKLGPPGMPADQRTDFDGGVWRYHPTRHVFEAYCEGFTNPWGIDFDDHGQAFVSNCVTPHLYHVIQGAHYQRRRFSPLSRYAYGRIDTIADHLHYVGGDWAKSRGATPEQLSAGGGHAHCGTMVYLGGKFPERWRNGVFMCNIHGSRVNCDLPRRKGSGFVAGHGDDLLASGDKWMRGTCLRYGPAGEVYVADWYDTGECHSHKPDRGNGRIYQVDYVGGKDQVRFDDDRGLRLDKEPNPAGIHRRRESPPTVLRAKSADISTLDDLALVNQQLNHNDWYVQHARRLLQERASAKRYDPEKVHAELRKILRENNDPTRRLRAVWALHVTGGLDRTQRTALLDDKNEYVRAWAIQLELEDGQASPAVLERYRKLAASDPSPVVRLYLAAGLQRLDHAQRWDLAEALLQHGEDVDDPNLPLMLWYAVEPLATADKTRAIRLAADCKFPIVRQYLARRIAEQK